MDISASSAANIADNGTINVNSSAQINTNSPAAAGPTSAQASVHTQNQDDKLKFVYEKAIDAYNAHINRYNIWMNYYALFTGAMFIGLYNIIPWCPSDTSSIFFSILISLVGLVSAICWWMSYTGYYAWLKSWISIVKKYEKAYLGEEGCLETPAIYQHIASCGNTKEPATYRPKYISTQKVTCIFIKTVVLSWMATLIFIAYTFFDSWIALVSGVVLGAFVFGWLHCTINNKSGKYYSSDLTGMVSI